MNKTSDDTYEWRPNSPGNYTIGNIEAKDNADNPAEKQVSQQSLCLYQDNEANNLTLSISDEDWHSVTQKGDISLKIDGTTYRKIEKIIVSDSEGTVAEVTDIADSFSGNKFALHQSIDLPNKEGEFEYSAKVLFKKDSQD